MTALSIVTGNLKMFCFTTEFLLDLRTDLKSNSSTKLSYENYIIRYGSITSVFKGAKTQKSIM